MRWLITFLLAAAVVLGAAFLFFGDELRSLVGIKSNRHAVEESATAKLLAYKPEAIKQIDLRVYDTSTQSEKSLTLLHATDGTWSQPGNWALREKEVQELVDTLTSLSTRFLPIPLVGDAEPLKQYGLDPTQHPVSVNVVLSNSNITLRFGAAPTTAGIPAFASPAYLRVGEEKEVIRIGSDVLRLISRSPEEYRRKQLFPGAPRVRLAGDSGPLTPILGDNVAQVAIRTPAGSFTLKRTGPLPPTRRQANLPSGEPEIRLNELAAAWEIAAPLRDRPEPSKLRAVLSAVPDLWADAFTTKGTDATSVAETGLDKPEREITITPSAGKPVVVKIGNISRTVVRDGPPGPPMGPFPPMPTKITEEYRYAKFDDNSLIFEMRTDRLGDLAVAATDLRDPTLARFTTPEVTKLTIAAKGVPAIDIVRKKGNKNAEKDEDKQDRWYVGGLPAETGKITELLDALAKLEARPGPQPPALNPLAPPPALEKAIIDNPDAKALADLGLDANAATTRITVVAQAEVPDGDAVPAPQEFTFIIGKADVEKKKLPVLMAGWPRVNLVDDASKKLIDRPALAYRGRRPIDTADLNLNRLVIADDKGKLFELAAKPKDPKQPDTTWALVKPVIAETDAAKAGKLASDLAKLEVVEFVDDAPKMEDLAAKFGLNKPRLTLDLAFTGAKPKSDILEVGAEVPGRPEVYARLNRGGSIFTIAKPLVDALLLGPEDLVALQQWSTTPDKLRDVTLTKAEAAPFQLKQADGKWTLAGAIASAADPAAMQPLLAALSNLRAEKYETLVANAADQAKYGFDKPVARVKLVYKEAKPDTEPPVEQDRLRELVIGSLTAPAATTRYAKLVGEANLPAAVFTVPADLVKPLEVTALDLLDRRLLTLDPKSITKVTLTGATPEGALTLTRDKDAWKPEGTPFPSDMQTTDTFLFSVSRLPIIRIAAFGPTVKWADYGLDKPTQTITLTGSGDKPSVHTIQLGKEEATGERYIRVDNGPAVGVISGAGSAAIALGKLDFIDRSMLNFDPSTLTALIRKKGADELEIAQAGTNWEIIKPAKSKADPFLVEDAIELLSRLRAIKVAAFAPTDLKPFGLDVPAAVVTLKLAGAKPESKSMKIGSLVDAAKPTGDRYAAIEGAASITVGVIPGALAKRLLADPIQFKDRSLGGFRGDPDKVVIERGDRKATFAKEGGTWKMTEPTAADAEQADLEELVNAAAKLRADELVAEKPADVKPYGLDQPTARVRFLVGANEVFALVIGGKEKDGPRVYSRVDKGDVVALLDAGLSARVLSEFRKRAVWSGVDASQVATLAISSGDTNFVLRKATGLWLDANKPEDRIDAAVVTDTLAVLAGLKADRYAVDKDADLKLFGLEKPRRVIVISAPGAPPKVLQIGGEVGGTNGKQAYARVDEKGRTDVFILSEADTATLLRDRAAYLSKK